MSNKDGKLIFSEEFSNEDNLSLQKDEIISELRKIFDPEIPVNIYDLGLIYDIDMNEGKELKVVMTLTSPNCPVAESLPQEVAKKIKELNRMKSLSLYLTFDPPWDKDKMSEDAKLALDIP